MEARILLDTRRLDVGKVYAFEGGGPRKGTGQCMENQRGTRVKRDWDLIQKILVKLEEKENSTVPLAGIDSPDHDWDKVRVHLHILKQAGLVDGFRPMLPGKVGIDANPYLDSDVRNLTWEGYEFLANIKSPEIWEKISSQAKEKGAELTLEFVKAAIPVAIQKLLGSQTID